MLNILRYYCRLQYEIPHRYHLSQFDAVCLVVRILSALIVFTRSQTSHQCYIQPWPRARNNTCHFLAITTTISQGEDDRVCSSLAVHSDFGLTYFVIGPICLCKMIVLTFLSWPLQAVSVTKSVTLDLLVTPVLRPGPPLSMSSWQTSMLLSNSYSATGVEWSQPVKPGEISFLVHIYSQQKKWFWKDSNSRWN